MLATSRVSLTYAIGAIVRSLIRFVVLLASSRIHQPSRHVGGELTFANDGSARVFRETVVDQRRSGIPAVLVVEFRLRVVHGLVHKLFQWESLVNTPLFAGFPGFISKLWLTDDQNEVYRGIYEWDRAEHAEVYAHVLCRLLALVAAPGSVDYRVLPHETRAQFLAECECLMGEAPSGSSAWWRVA